MTVKKGKKEYFPRVKEAREALAERARELIDLSFELLAVAKANGDAKSLEAANAHIRFLMQHMPVDPLGTSMIDVSVDTPKQIDSKIGPSIQIGFKLGGMSEPKALPPAVIDVEVEEKDE